MRKIGYPVVFHPETVGWSVSVPDLDGCCTQGDTLEEAVEMAREAVGLMLEDAVSFPPASDPATLRTGPGDQILWIPFERPGRRRERGPDADVLRTEGARPGG